MNKQQSHGENRKKGESMISFHFVVLSFKVDSRKDFDSTQCAGMEWV